MPIVNHLTRLGAMAAGGLILYLAAETTLAHLGQTSGPGANLMRALALGVGVGAIAIGVAWHHGRIVLATVIAMALIAGEAYGLLSTAERMVATREATQAGVRASAAKRETAAARVTSANRALTRANADAVAEASKRHCARECRKLLEGAITKAGLELIAARKELAAIPAVTASATPLADRLGLPSWAIDLIQAALASLAANGLGASLIAFGAHGGPKPRKADLPAQLSDAMIREALANVRPSGQPSPRDVLQASFATMADDAERLAAFLAPNGRPDGGPPRGPGKRTKRRPDGATVIAFPARTFAPDVPANAPAANRRDQVLAALTADLEAGRTFGSQAEICEAYGIARSTLSDWLAAWEADGISFRRAATGRCKAVARA